MVISSFDDKINLIPSKDQFYRFVKILSLVVLVTFDKLLILNVLIMDIDTYNKKRDFTKTKEPKGSKADSSQNGQRFVIQKHQATNLHFDFRLEVEGVLKSWSIPKGPSTDPNEKRMAIPTEDHPLAYAEFEGTIPEDQYGGGTVMIWDKGTYRDISDDNNSLATAYKNGVMEILLNGNKIQGGYSLVKMNSGSQKGNWLMIKKDDMHADGRKNPVSTQNKSVVSGRTLQEIEKEQ